MEVILIIEDDEAIRDIISYSLSTEGYSVIEAKTGSEGLAIIENKAVDLILLDLMLPDINGFEICKKISAEYRIPIIMLTAKSDIMDKVVGLEIGADDYITKPFVLREVIARVKSCLRRAQLISLSSINENNRGYCDNRSDEMIICLTEQIKIYCERHEVFLGDNQIHLKPKEFELLITLAQNRGRVFSRDKLLECVWGYDYAGESRTVDVHIQRLRKKLRYQNGDTLIKTIFGTGYKMI